MINSNNAAISFYVPYLSLRQETQNVIYKKIISPKIKEFFKSRSIREEEYVNIQSNYEIAPDIDFKHVPFNYFYEVIFDDIQKDLKAKFKTKYIVTFDKNCTSQYCDYTKVWFDMIKLNKKPVLYIIFFDINEIIQLVRKEAEAAYREPDYK